MSAIAVDASPYTANLRRATELLFNSLFTSTTADDFQRIILMHIPDPSGAGAAGYTHMYTPCLMHQWYVLHVRLLWFLPPTTTQERFVDR